MKSFYGIGLIYKNGLGVPKSDEKTLKYYIVAANNGNDMAQLEVGRLYYKGNGVERDISN